MSNPEAAVVQVRLARVYDDERHESDRTFLVERLWPRGIRRDQLVIDGWCKDAAPSTALRQWFSHDVAKWTEFRRRYTSELDAHPAAWEPLATAAREGPITLLYSSRDREHNNAVVLRDYLITHLEKG